MAAPFTSSDSDLQKTAVWATTTLRLCVEEVRDPRSVAVNRNGQPTVVDVANAIFVTDSGEQVKSVFWDEEFHKFYHKLKPKMLVELVDFQAKGPDRNQQYRVGNLHFELKATPKSDVVVLKHEYRLRGPAVSFAAEVKERCPGRHKISAVITSNFVQMCEVFVGRVEIVDGTPSPPTTLNVTLREVFPIERHRLVKGTLIALTGDVSKTGSMLTMSVRSWQDVDLAAGKNSFSPPSDFKTAAARSKVYGVGLPTPSASHSRSDQSSRGSLSASAGRAGKENLVTQLKHHSSDESDEFTTPPPRRDRFSSVDILENADFELDPWHCIQGTITENFFLEDGDFVGHVGEITVEEADGTSLPIQVKLRCVKSSDEDRLCVDTKVIVRGVMRRLADDVLELETGWADVEFENDPYGRHDFDEDSDAANDVVSEPATAKELKNLQSPTFLKIVGNVNKRFAPDGVKYEGRIRVRSDGVVMVNVIFDWSDGEEEPQSWILDLHTGARVEIEGTVRVEGKILLMEAQTCKEVESPSGADVSKDSTGMPATPKTNNSFSAFSTPDSRSKSTPAAGSGPQNQEGNDAASHRVLKVDNACPESVIADDAGAFDALLEKLGNEMDNDKTEKERKQQEQNAVGGSEVQPDVPKELAADGIFGPAESSGETPAPGSKRKIIKTEKFLQFEATLPNAKPKAKQRQARRAGGSAKKPKSSEPSLEVVGQ